MSVTASVIAEEGAIKDNVITRMGEVERRLEKVGSGYCPCGAFGTLLAFADHPRNLWYDNPARCARCHKLTGMELQQIGGEWQDWLPDHPPPPTPTSSRSARTTPGQGSSCAVRNWTAAAEKSRSASGTSGSGAGMATLPFTRRMSAAGVTKRVCSGGGRVCSGGGVCAAGHGTAAGTWGASMTGDDMTTCQEHPPRICPLCGASSTNAVFGRNKSHADSLSTYCRACCNAKAVEARAKTAKPIQPRSCRCCGVLFTPAHPNVHYCSEECREVRQKAEMKRLSRESYYANWARRRAMAKAWRAANPDKVHVHRASFYARHKDKEVAAHRAWMTANPGRLTQIAKDTRRQQAAIGAGKCSPILRRTGFVLVHTKAGQGEREWRATRPGMPVGVREVVAAVYTLVCGKWVVTAPFVASQPMRRFALRLARKEKRSAA